MTSHLITVFRGHNYIVYYSVKKQQRGIPSKEIYVLESPNEDFYVLKDFSIRKNMFCWFET